MRLIELFSEHPNSIGMSYFAHMVRAFGFSFAMIYGSVVCFIHAVFPFLLEHDASRLVSTLYEKMGEK